MLKLRSGAGVILTILLLAAVGAAFWLRRPSSPLDEYLAATPPPLPDTVFVGEEMVLGFDRGKLESLLGIGG